MNFQFLVCVLNSIPEPVSWLVPLILCITSLIAGLVSLYFGNNALKQVIYNENGEPNDRIGLDNISHAKSAYRVGWYLISFAGLTAVFGFYVIIPTVVLVLVWGMYTILKDAVKGYRQINKS